MNSIAIAPHHVNQEPDSVEQEQKAYSVVLQPHGCLDSVTCVAFHSALERALQQATDAVVIDFLWVDTVKAEGVAVLMAGVKLAVALGKRLSFRSIDLATRNMLEAEWENQRDMSLGAWKESYQQDFRQFLDTMSRRRTERSSTRSTSKVSSYAELPTQQSA